jgi:hypothetical protein
MNPGGGVVVAGTTKSIGRRSRQALNVQRCRLRALAALALGSRSNVLLNAASRLKPHQLLEN